ARARARTTCRTTCATSAIPPCRSTPCRSPAPEPTGKRGCTKGPGNRALFHASNGRPRRAVPSGLAFLAVQLGLDRIQAEVAQQRLCLVLGQRLHAAQAALDGAGLAAG